MSTVKVWLGSLRNASQPHVTGDFTRPSIVNDHRSSGVCGVGPAERTGKSVTRYWPGGRRSSTSAGRRRPRNPREIKPAMLSLLAERSDGLPQAYSYFPLALWATARVGWSYA